MLVTVQSVVNEIMFIAMAKPENVDITVEYSGVTDSLQIKVMPTGFDYSNTTAQQYKSARVLSKDVFLAFPGALKSLAEVKDQLIQVITAEEEVAA